MIRKSRWPLCGLSSGELDAPLLLYGALYQDIESTAADPVVSRRLRFRFVIAFGIIALFAFKFGQTMLR